MEESHFDILLFVLKTVILIFSPVLCFTIMKVAIDSIPRYNYFYYEGEKKVQADNCYISDGLFVCEKDNKVFHVESYLKEEE